MLTVKDWTHPNILRARVEGFKLLLEFAAELKRDIDTKKAVEYTTETKEDSTKEDSHDSSSICQNIQRER